MEIEATQKIDDFFRDIKISEINHFAAINYIIKRCLQAKTKEKFKIPKFFSRSVKKISHQKWLENIDFFGEKFFFDQKLKKSKFFKNFKTLKTSINNANSIP